MPLFQAESIFTILLNIEIVLMALPLTFLMGSMLNEMRLVQTGCLRVVYLSVSVHLRLCT